MAGLAGRGFSWRRRFSGVSLTVVLSMVAALLAVAPAPLAQAVVATSYPAGTGSIPIHEFQTFGITDQASLKVNLATGNLLIDSTDFSSGALEIQRSWNSLDQHRWDDELGYGWALNYSSDTRLDPDCGDTGPKATLSGGLRFKFTKRSDGLYNPPTGLHLLDLRRTSGTSCSNNIWAVNDRLGKGSMTFGGPSYTEPYGRYLTQVTDGSGNRIQVDYGHVHEVTDMGLDRYFIQTKSVYDALRNRRLTYMRSADGKKIRGFQDWTGRTASYGVDQYGRLERFTDFAGKVTSYNFDANSLIRTITDPNGNAISIGYDASRRVSSISRAGLTWSFKYDNGVDGDWRPACPAAQTDVFVPGLPYRSRLCFDGEGRMVTQRRGDVESVQYQFDANSNITKAGWAKSHASGAFDYQSKLTSMTDAVGGTTSLGYGDSTNPYLPTRVTNPQGRSYGFAHDSRGLTTRIADPAGQSQSYTYNSNGTLATSTDQLGRITAYGYDAAGRMTSFDPPGTAIGVSYYSYDGLDRVAVVTDGKGQKTAFGYDAMDRVTRVTYADGSYLAYTYDGVGNLTNRYDSAINASTSYSYDALHRLATETAPGESKITYGYDAASRMTSYTDGGGTTRYEYGWGSLLTKVTEPSGAVTRYEIETNPGGESYHPPFPPKITYPNGVTVTNRPDMAGRLVSTEAKNSAGTVLMHRRYSYDKYESRPNLLASANPSFESGTTGWLFSQSGSASTAWAVSGKYSARVTGTVTNNDVSAWSSFVSVEAGKTYSARITGNIQRALGAGMRVRLEWWNGSTPLGDNTGTATGTGVATATVSGTAPSGATRARIRVFDDGTGTWDVYLDGAMIVQGPVPDIYYDSTPPSTGLVHFEYDDVANTATAFSYDALDRLTRALSTNRSTGAVVGDYGYGYDATGNRTSYKRGSASASESSNEVNQLKSRTSGSTTWTYGHDADGNLTSSSWGLSAAYNAKDQTTSIKGYTGATLAAAYNGDGQSELRQLGSKTITNSAVGITRVGGDRFTRGPDGRLVSMRTAEGATHYYLTDIRDSVIGLTSSTGSLTSFGYNGPAGIVGAQSGDAAALRNPFRFTGELYSPELHLYKIGERWYDPELGRWTQADPLAQPYDPRQANRYAYAAGDPVNFIDPSGLFVPAAVLAVSLAIRAAPVITRAAALGSRVARPVRKLANRPGVKRAAAIGCSAIALVGGPYELACGSDSITPDPSGPGVPNNRRYPYGTQPNDPRVRPPLRGPGGVIVRVFLSTSGGGRGFMAGCA